MSKKSLSVYIRDIPDFPKKGIIFKDITTLLNDKRAFKESIDLLAKEVKGQKIDYVVSVESRGFIFGAALAYKLGAGFVPVRKKGKLPGKTKRVTYQLEYGTDTLEIHSDAMERKARVLVVDDLLATGGTICAVIKLLKTFHARIVGTAFLIDLTFLHGHDKLKGYSVHSLIQY